MKTLNKEELEKLPLYVQQKVRNYLKAYSSCNIIFENGKYEVRTFYALQRTYCPDRKFIGEVRQEDIYTLEERINNYRSEFGDEPYHLLVQLKNK